MNLEQYTKSLESRILGRVFTYDDQLHLVVGVDEASGQARCTRRGLKGIDQILMPVTEVSLRLVWEQERLEREELERIE